MKALAATAALLAIGTAAQAQFVPPYMPNPRPPNFMPNIFNRSTQPLSPYLNLIGGVNPGVNYYFGTRPGLPTGGANIFGQQPAYQPFVGPMAGGFLPQAAMPNDGTAPSLEIGGQPIVLRSPSHPVVFGNQFGNHGGFSSVYAGSMNRAGAMPQYGGLQQRAAPAGSPRP